MPLQDIVLHYTGMVAAEDWIAAVCDPKTELSAHYLVDEDGRVVQLVDESKRAWHAGKSFWRGITDMNSASIGIELHNPGHEYGYREFTAAQIRALKALVRDIAGRHGMDLRTCLVAHSDIAPTRKIDPGELFPWKELAQEGLGVWPDISERDVAPFSLHEATKLLAALGYDCSDETMALASLNAFQRRFQPERLEQGPDAVTMARLREVVRLRP